MRNLKPKYLTFTAKQVEELEEKIEGMQNRIETLSDQNYKILDRLEKTFKFDLDRTHVALRDDNFSSFELVQEEGKKPVLKTILYQEI